MRQPESAGFNLAEYVLEAGRACPEKIALAVLSPSGARRVSYGALRAFVLGLGQGLLARGLVPGDRVLLRLGNEACFPVAYLGALAVGLVPVPSSAQLSAPEVTALCADLAPRAVLASPGVALPLESDAMVIEQAELEAMMTGPPASFHRGDPERLGYIVYTSGSSGVARGVCHAHRAILARRMMFDGWYGLTAQDRLLHAGAFNWTFTLGTGLLDPWTMGATALVAREGTALEALPLLLKRHDATLFAAAPGVFRRLLRGDLPPLPQLRHALSAGESLSEQVAQRWYARTGTPIYEAYGMSECSTFISASPARPAMSGTMGRPQAGRRVALLGASGPVEEGTPGEIAVHESDPGLMLGYLNAPDETAARMREGWFLTSDQGVVTESGDIRYLGRLDDVMNAGGYRVAPLEVEQALSGFAGLGEIGVCSVRVGEGTEVIAAGYTATAPLDHDALTAFASTRLARYKQPRIYRHLPELPKGGNGKRNRRALRCCLESLLDTT